MFLTIYYKKLNYKTCQSATKILLFHFNFQFYEKVHRMEFPALQFRGLPRLQC